MDDTERIWQAYHDELLRFIHSRVAGSAHAEDILQNVFLRVHAHLGALSNRDKVRSWIFQIARNAIADHFRGRQSKGANPYRLTGSEPAPDSGPVPDSETCSIDNCMLPMIERLPEKYRAAVMMAEIDGLTQTEIADKLGISISGAKSRVQRGRTMVKAMLLDCCEFEFDHRGNIINYDRKKPPADIH